jgi:hypothetical protein
MDMKTDTDQREHDRMVGVIFQDTSILKSALRLPRVFVRGREFVFDWTTGERADLVFQDRFDAYKGDTDAVAHVLELKSDLGDHEIVGQLDKAVQAVFKIGQATKHWGKVVGVAVARRYTASGVRLLRDAGHVSFLWSEDRSGVRLVDAIPKRAVTP